jgi:hypothetical protein
MTTIVHCTPVVRGPGVAPAVPSLEGAMAQVGPASDGLLLTVRPLGAGATGTPSARPTRTTHFEWCRDGRLQNRRVRSALATACLVASRCRRRGSSSGPVRSRRPPALRSSTTTDRMDRPDTAPCSGDHAHSILGGPCRPADG